MGLVLRTFTMRGPESMTTVFRAVVLPHLKYTCQLWSPVSLGHIRKLEYVQHTFTSRLAGLGDLDTSG